MVVGAFPAAKLGALLIKQISKPLATTIKNQAKQSPFFRTYICMPPAHFYNWCEVKTKMWIMNLGKPIQVPTLNESMAIELGANLLGEGIIFLIAAGVLIAEYNRSSRKEAKKEEEAQARLATIEMELQELFLLLEEQRVMIKELSRSTGRRSLKNMLKDDKLSAVRQNLQALTKVDRENPMTLKENQEENEFTPAEKSELLILDKQENFLLKAVRLLEQNELSNEDSERELSILCHALNYLYSDVFKLPLSID